MLCEYSISDTPYFVPCTLYTVVIYGWIKTSIRVWGILPLAVRMLVKSLMGHYCDRLIVL